MSSEIVPFGKYRGQSHIKIMTIGEIEAKEIPPLALPR